MLPHCSLRANASASLTRFAGGLRVSLALGVPARAAHSLVCLPCVVPAAPAALLVVRKPLSTRLPSSIPSSNLPSVLSAPRDGLLKKPAAATALPLPVALGPAGLGLVQPKSIAANAATTGACASLKAPATAASRLPQRATALPLPSAIPAPSAAMASAARSVPSCIPSFLPSSFMRSSAAESPAPSRAASPVRSAAPSPAPVAPTPLPSAASTHSAVATPVEISSAASTQLAAGASAEISSTAPITSAAATSAVPAAFVVAAVNDDDLAAILAAEEQRELDEAAEAITAAAAAAAPAATEECAEVALPACFTEPDAVIPFELAVDAALPSLEVEPCVTAAAVSCELPVLASTPVHHASDAASAEDDDELAAAEEEDGFGHFAIPESESELAAQPPATAVAAAASAAVRVRAPPRPDCSVPTPFPYELDCSEATVARREVQIVAAQNQVHSLRAEIDLYASKLFQLSQLAAQPQFAQLAISQMLLDTISGGSSDTMEAELH